jgi:hypothetical protein
MALESNVVITDWDIDYPVKSSANEVYHPVNRPLVYTCEYTGVNNIKRASVRIIVDGVTINTGSELIVDPDLGASTIYTFDISEIVKNYVSSTLPTLGNSSGVDLADNTVTADIRISIADISDVAGVLTVGTYRDMGSSEVFTACNAYYDDSGIHSALHVDTDNDGILRKLYMSNMPGTVRLRPADDLHVGFYDPNSISPVTLVVTTYAGASVENSDAISIGSAIPDAGVFSIGPANIETYDATLITDNTDYYTVAIKLGPSTQKTYKVIIDRSCDDSYTSIAFLNRFGFFDYVTFRGDKMRSKDTKQKYIDKPRTLSRSSVKSDRTMESIGLVSSISYKVNSGLIKEEAVLWLEELLESPEVYFIEDGGYYPVKIKSSKVNTEDKVKALYSLSCEFEYVKIKR